MHAPVLDHAIFNPNVNSENVETTPDTPKKRIACDAVSLNSKKLCLDQSPRDLPLINDHFTHVSLFLSDETLQKHVLLKLLQENLEGQAVLAKYEKKWMLDDRDRTTIVSILINRCDVKKIAKPPVFLGKLASLILEIFPTETKDIYHIPPLSTGNDTKNAKGKLPDKWRNVIYRLRQYADSKKKTKENVELVSIKTETNVVDFDVADHLNWLEEKREPWEKVQIHWEATATYRLERYKELATNDEILTEWPILKSALASRLVALDFSRLYPGRELHVVKTWEKLFGDIYTLKKDKIKKIEGKKLCELYESHLGKSNVDLDALRLLILPFLLTSKSKVKSTEAISLPSSAEVQGGLIIHSKSSYTVISDIEARVNQYKKVKCRAYPCIAVVAPNNLTELENVYVAFENQLWSMSSTIDALEFLFHLYIVFNLPYPADYYHIWLFLQQLLFEIHLPKFDKKIPIITRTIADLNALRKSREK